MPIYIIYNFCSNKQLLEMFPNLTNYQDEPEPLADGQGLLGEFVRRKLNTIIKI